MFVGDVGINMKKWLVILTMLALSGCANYNKMHYTENNLEKVQIGMSLREYQATFPDSWFAYGAVLERNEGTQNSQYKLYLLPLDNSSGSVENHWFLFNQGFLVFYGGSAQWVCSQYCEDMDLSGCVS